MTPREIILHTEAWIYLVLAAAIWWSASGYMRRIPKPSKHRFYLALGLVLPAALAWPWYSSLVDERRKAVLAGIAEHDRTERLRLVQPGEKLPAYDHRRSRLFKIGGRYFVVPIEYAYGMSGLSFFWIDGKPSVRQPGRSPVDNSPGKSYRELGIDLSIHVDPSVAHIPTREYMQQFDARGELDVPELLFPGVVRRDLRRRDSPEDSRAFCIATDALAPDGLPAVTLCPGSRKQYPTRYGTAFWWRPGVLVSASMHETHLKDWPAISLEVYRVINLVKEEQP